MDIKETKLHLNSVYGMCAKNFIYADTDSIKFKKVEMKEIIHVCITTQIDYSDIPLQDRIYIAFGRVVTSGCYGTNEIEYIINMIKSEFEFLEGVWNGEKRKS